MKQIADLSEEVLANNGLAELHAIVVDYIQHHESALALDLMCEYIIENNVAITQWQFNSIVDFVKKFSAGSIVVSDQTLLQLKKLSGL